MNEIEQQVTTTDIENRWEKYLKLSATKLESRNFFDPSTIMSGCNNPYMLNHYLKAIQTRASRFKREDLEKLLESPQTNEEPLRAASHYFYNTIAPIMKLENMYADILTYRVYVKLNELCSENKLQKEYKDINDWIRGFQPQRAFRDITLQSIIEGKRFYCLREIPEKDISFLQPMPSDYCKIVHRYEGGWQYAFNMMYFYNMSVCLDNYHPIFRAFFEELEACSKIDKKTKRVSITHAPKDVVAYKQDSNWFFWKTVPIGIGWVFGLDDASPDVVPTLSSMFLDANELNSYKLLEEELLSIPLRQVLTAEIPLLTDNKTGSHTNNTAVTTEFIYAYDALVRGLLPNGVDFVSAPYEEFKLHSFNNAMSKDNIVGDAMQNLYSQMGISGLLTTTDKPNLTQVKNAQVTEARFVDKIYGQYKYFLNYCINRIRKLNKWEVFIDGDVWGDEGLYTKIEKALTLGITSLMPEFFSFFNTELGTEKATSILVDKFGIYDSMKPMVSAYQSTDKKNGRPRADENNIESDNTAKSIEAGTNTSETRIVEKTTVMSNLYQQLSDEEKELFLQEIEE